MPATWPPVSPLCAAAAAEVLVEVAEGDDVAVIVIGFSFEEATTGSVTPLHRVVASENTQHESVLFGELAEQYEHSDPTLDVNPQLLG